MSIHMVMIPYLMAVSGCQHQSRSSVIVTHIWRASSLQQLLNRGELAISSGIEHDVGLTEPELVSGLCKARFCSGRKKKNRGSMALNGPCGVFSHGQRSKGCRLVLPVRKESRIPQCGEMQTTYTKLATFQKDFASC